MSQIAFLRGVNVGGHRTFRPSVLARELSAYDVVNVGAAGTFIVRRPVSPARLRSELLRKLPFEAEVALCAGRDLARLVEEDPFGTQKGRSDVVPFVTILLRPSRSRVSAPITFPPDGKWLLRVIEVRKQFVFGVYRRHMKAIGYLSQIDKLFGVPGTTRNWNTIKTIVRILNSEED